MELLTRTLRSCRRLAGHNGWFTVLTAAVVVGIEIIGRRMTSDWADVVVAALLAVALFVIGYRHYYTPLPWLKPVVELGRRVWDGLKQWFVEIGYDLRGNPPVRRGLPPIILAVMTFLVGWAAFLIGFGKDFPQNLRDFGVDYSYLGYLVLMTVVWGAMCVGIALSFWFSVGLLHDDLANGEDGLSRGPSRAGLILGLIALLLVGSRFFYLSQVLAACLAVWGALAIIALTSRDYDVQFLWRPRGSVRVRSVSAGHSAILMYLLGTLLAIDLVLTACGRSRCLGVIPYQGDMPLTVALGTILGWVLLGLLCMLVWQSILDRLRNPGRKSRRVLHVTGAGKPEHRRTIRERFARREWRIRYEPESPDACAVRIEIVEPTRSEAQEFDPPWPLKVSLDDLDVASVRDRLERRSDIQIRRRIMAGFERLFKSAQRRKFRNGHGFLLAPHLPLFYGMRRDEPEPEPGPFDSHMVFESIGPPYHRAFPRLARFLAHRMLRALEIDIIFVEDGVSFRRFSRVVRRLFELYDKHDGRRPVADPDFVGLHGTRVLIYDMQFDNQFESSVYPEPKFANLGRARVLLVFRDRSEHEELVEPPFDASRTPAPLGLGR